jgi:hypothetical protein
MFMLFLFLNVSQSFAGSEGMTSMPAIHAKAVYKVDDPAALQNQSGFGAKADQVRAQNAMMIEGSGMGDMKMDTREGVSPSESARYELVLKTDKGQKDIRFASGTQTIRFQVLDRRHGKKLEGLSLNGEVSMTTMDMGTEKPKITEPEPGIYAAKADFSMAGAWALKVIFQGGETAVLPLEVREK